MVDRVHVLHVISSPAGGGAEVLVREMASSMNDEQCTTEAVYFNDESASCKGVIYKANEMVLGASARNPRLIFKLRDVFKSKLRKYPNLIIHAHLTWPLFYVALASLGLNTTLIYTEHNTTNRRRDFSFLRFVERFFYARYSRVICISNATEKSLQDWIGKGVENKTRVVPNGARLYDFKCRNYNGELTKFISVGSLSKQKNFKIALISLSLLKKRNWIYTIIGEGSEQDELKALVDKLGIKDNVIFIGWSDHVNGYLYDADIQLIPSLWEGFGLVAIEGLSTGLPVVSSKVDGLSEVLGAGKLSSVFFVNDCLNPTEWAGRIEACCDALLKDVATLSNDSRQQSEKFTLDKMMKGYLSVYIRLLCREK